MKSKNKFKKKTQREVKIKTDFDTDLFLPPASCYIILVFALTDNQMTAVHDQNAADWL